MWSRKKEWKKNCFLKEKKKVFNWFQFHIKWCSVIVSIYWLSAETAHNTHNKSTDSKHATLREIFYFETNISLEAGQLLFNSPSL